MPVALRILLPIALLGVVACGSSPVSTVSQAKREIASGRIDAAVARLERGRAEHPGSAEVRDALGSAYYRRARKALDEKRFDAYEDDLERAISEWVESLRIDPTSDHPHTWMGIAAAYQGNLDGALESFRNALRLAPMSWVAHTNLAQTLVYRGELSQARRWLKKAERLHADPVTIELDLALAAWRQGDLMEARDLFQSAYALNPKRVNVWDEAPVADPIETFDDFTSYCCSNPACGPYMEEACRELQLEVRRREVSRETVLKELRIEMERRRKLREIYERRKDLRIEVEPPEPVER